MRKVHRIVFRLDFPINYEVFNKPGDIIRMLKETGEDLWSEITEGQPRRISGRATKEDGTYFHQLSVEPASIHGSMEVLKGIEWDAAPNCQFLEASSAVVSEVISSFGLDVIDRCGLRIYATEFFGEKFPNPLERFQGFIEKEFLNSFQKSAGNLEDMSFLFEGKAEDEIEYRVLMGPGARGDLRKFFENLKTPEPNEDEPLTHHISADMDFYERGFSLGGSSLYKWSVMKWELAAAVMNMSLERMTKG